MMQNASVAECALNALSEMQRAVSIKDYIKFTNPIHPNGVGEVVSVTSDRIELQLFRCINSEVLTRYSIAPLNPRDHPMASQDEMVEVYQTLDIVCIPRQNITDVAYIVPIQEVESGRFYLSCAENAFVIRFFNNGHQMLPWISSFYFSRHLMEPMSVRLFHAMNTLSDNIRRCLFHRPESVTTTQSFKLPLFSVEAFWYLAYKVVDHCISIMINRKQRAIKYYSSLKMESLVKHSTLIYLRILSKPSLAALRKVLGAGIGLGLAVNRPTKNRPIGYCCINSNFTSIECGDVAPQDIISNPRMKCLANGIDLIFSEENRILSGHVRFKKMVVRRAADVTSRLPTAQVESISSGVYLEAMFYYNNVLFEVVEIDNYRSLVKSTPLQDPNVGDITLPMEVVQQQVADFGK